MATWHQNRNPVTLYHATQWTVVIDPPNQMRALMLFSTHDLAKVYMRNLKANNPGVFPHAYVLAPGKPPAGKLDMLARAGKLQFPPRRR